MTRWRGMTIVVTIVVACWFILDTPARAETHISPDGPAAAELSIDGPAAGQNAAPSTGSSAVPTSSLQSIKRVDGRRRQADHHQFSTADCQPGAGRAGHPHFVHPCSAR